jgi:DNA-binding transcriptional MerR regulator
LVSRDAGEPPVKLYYRIGEVARIVGVEAHVLRYWESEFRSIRPQKSRSGQRVYSRHDVERLLRVKELLYTQRFTIAGARRKLKEPSSLPAAASSPVDEAPTQEATNPLLGTVRALRETLLGTRDEIRRLLVELDQEPGDSKPSGAAQ